MLSKLLLVALAGASSVLAEGFNVTIVYVEPPGGCTTANQSTCASNPPDSGSLSVSEPPQPGPITTLPPATHWSTCTRCISNLVPKEPETPCPLYYGNADPCKEGYFGTLTYFFKASVVVLDHFALATVEYDAASGSLSVGFQSREAFAKVSSSWAAGIVLVANLPNCGSATDRCYFSVTGLEASDASLTIVAAGKASDPEKLINKAEAEWGWWVPRPGSLLCSLSGGGQGSGSNGSGSNGPGASPGPGSGNGNGNGNSANNGNGNGTYTNGTQQSSFSEDRTRCVAPVDTVHGLPTACFGPYFDDDLDDQMGYSNIDTLGEFDNFIDELAPGDDNAIQRRWLIKSIFNKIIPKPILNVAKAIIAPIQKLTTISGSISKDLSFKIPDSRSDNPDAKRLKDPSLKQTQSPWGDAVLLKSFGSSPQSLDEPTGQGAAGYLNVYCVGCGVDGRATLTGRAAFTPVGGFTQGEVEMRIDLNMVFKLGIDAKIKYQKDFESSLLDVGLPGLSYGIVTIGPRVSLGSRVSLLAAAEGKLLAGAEMGITNALAKLDFVNPSSSKTEGWEPYFKPVFEAEGQIMLAAELGLPVSVKCGLKIGGFDKSVGLTDEPSIKATAQAAASIGQASGGGFSAGFASTDGCTGIATQISWRNRIYVDLLGSKKDLFDTKDKVLKRGCIALPGRENPPSSSSTATPSGIPATTNVDGDTPGTTQTAIPTSTDEDEGTPLTTASSSTPSTDEQDDQDPTPEASEDSQDPSPLRLAKRQTATPPAAAIQDLTSQVKGGSTELSYTSTPIPASPYNRTDGFELSLMVDPGAETALVACGDGNVYLAGVDSLADMTFCTELFENYRDLLVGDGSGRILHYYNNTMGRVGASRLRVSDGFELPALAVPVVMVAFEGEYEGGGGTGTVDSDSSNNNSTATVGRRQEQQDQAGDDGFRFHAVDPAMELSYPAVCTYADGSMPRLFLVRDPVDGLAVLATAAVEHSITGGKVQDCFLMPVVEGKYDEDKGGYAGYGKTNETSFEYDA
ncbi:hypothetical protein MCOR12_011258 [Pyricularia oryzae]|nr:hypothetical protein MCOR20_008440 [Pyricularia oryzae]KAI6582136.1 hypothetical protein MCOR12_011258 [Pyricularia oryzae]